MRAVFATLSVLALLNGSMANPLVIRQATTTTQNAMTTQAPGAAPATTEAPAKATILSGSDSPDEATGSLTSGTAEAPASPTGIPGTSLSRCTSDNVGEFPPFCEPQNATQKEVGASYYVTWDSDLFKDNETIRILVNYINATGSQSQVAFQSDQIPKNFGYYVLPVDESWLQGQNALNVSLAMFAYDPNVNAPAQNYSGPTIELITPSASHYPAPDPTPYNPLGLEIGLPIGIVGLFVILGGLYVWNRKTRRIDVGGLRQLMGKKKAGYGARQSKRQRMKGGAAIQEAELRDGVYGGENEHGEVELDQRRAGGGNAFRDEIARQQTGGR